MAGRDVECRIAMRRGQRRRLRRQDSEEQLLHWVEKAKAISEPKWSIRSVC